MDLVPKPRRFARLVRFRALSLPRKKWKCQHYSGENRVILLGTINAFSKFGGPFKITALSIHGTNMKLEFEIYPDISVRRSEM
jgi:hypothetical protein